MLAAATALVTKNIYENINYSVSSFLEYRLISIILLIFLVILLFIWISLTVEVILEVRGVLESRKTTRSRSVIELTKKIRSVSEA